MAPPRTPPAPANPSEPPVTPPAPGENENEIERIAARIEDLDEKLTEGLSGERTWTTKTITSLQQEIADLKANLQALAGSNVATEVAELKAELTRLSQELTQLRSSQPPPQEPPATPPQTPPIAPPDPNEIPPAAPPEGAGDHALPTQRGRSATPSAPPVRGKRVV